MLKRNATIGKHGLNLPNPNSQGRWKGALKIAKNKNSAREVRLPAILYLKKAFELNKKIDADIAELVRLQEQSTCIPSTSNLSQDKAACGNMIDITGNTATRIADLEKLIKSKIDRLVDIKQVISNCIEKISAETMRLILQKRYLSFQEWDEIADDLNYTLRHTMRLHALALQEIERKQLL